MANYPIEDFVREVRIILDLNPRSNNLLSSTSGGSLSIDELIRSRLVVAVRWVIREAPFYKLGVGKSFRSAIAWDGQVVGVGSGRIKLPDDFLRLLSFQMSDWHRPATSPISEDSSRYALQASRFRGIRGNPERPVVAILNEPIGLTLQFFSCEAGERVYIKQADYIPEPQIEHEAISLSDKLYPSALYYTAYLVMISLGYIAEAEQFLNLSKDLLQ